MRERDDTATSALRSALSAIDNAEAVDAPPQPTLASGPIAGAVVGVGAAEVPRRVVSEATWWRSSKLKSMSD
jgi:hypothetical protein